MPIDEIRKICFVGSGTMGCFNSLVSAVAGYDVVLYDVSEETLQSVTQRHQMLGMAMIERWDMTEEKLKAGLARVRTTADAAEAAADADLLSESVFERVGLKREVHGQFDRLCPSKTIMTTNTSTLLVSQIEDVVDRGDRFAALHFHLLATLVDIVPGPRTDPKTIDVLERFARSIGQIPIIAKKENKGYLHNAMLVDWLKSGLRLVADGVVDLGDVDRSWMIVHQGSGPFAVMDGVGLNVVFDAIEGEFEQTGDEALKGMLEVLRPHIERGELGVKTGKGFYAYPEPAFMQSGFLEGE